MKKFKTKDWIMWSLIAVVLVGVVAAVIVAACIPNTAYGEWIKSNVWDYSVIFNDFSGLLSKTIGTLITICVIAAVSKIIRVILAKIMQRGNRAKTIVQIIDGFIKYATAICIFFLVLSIFGVNTAALWASAGILTLIIGLGCQSLISDIVAGLFIIFEKEYDVGEIVVIDGFRGTVKEINIRTTNLLDAAGDIKIINHSNISSVVNLSRENSVAICDCGIEYGDSLYRVESIIAQELPKMKEKIPGIIEGPYYKGVSQLADSSVVVKFVAMCKEEDRYQVTRDLNRQVKLMFDHNNVNIPFPQIVVNKPNEFTRSTNEQKQKAKEFVRDQREASKLLDDQEK